jgi:heme/copper-type cytochrome/quinol oxidase subunit 1
MEFFELAKTIFESTLGMIDMSNGSVRIMFMILIGLLIFFAEDIAKLAKRNKKTEETSSKEQSTAVSSDKPDNHTALVHKINELNYTNLTTQISELKNQQTEHQKYNQDMIMRWHVRLDRMEDQIDDVMKTIIKEIEDLEKKIDGKKTN